MFEGYIYYGIVAFVIFVLGILGILRDFPYRRHLVVISFLIFLPTAFFSTLDLLSRPRPVNLMLEFQRPNPEVAEMLAVYMVEDSYIMLLLNWEGLPYPRYFRFPWDQEMAEQLQDARNKAEAKGVDGVLLDYPFDPSLDRREHPWAHPLPTPSQTQPKQAPDNSNMFHFEHPSQGA